MWVNSADDPANCSFTLMSVVRRGDLVVTIGTGGRSPALATWLRKRLGDELGPEYETLLDLLSEARESIRASGRSSEEPDWQQALDSGMLDLIRAGSRGRSQGAAARMSLLVVGLNHRTVPVAAAGAAFGRARRAAQGARVV